MTVPRPADVYRLQQAAKLAGITGTEDRIPNPKNANAAKHIQKAYDAASMNDLLEEEPIRTIHHLSCTGGTLITKCIASMANALVLNEINLHSKIPLNQKGRPEFTPTDIISLLHQAAHEVPFETVSRIFLEDLTVLRKEQWSTGRALILRDHCHSQFLVEGEAINQPTLLDVASTRFPVRSVVTVRNPADSYISMKKYGWHKTFEPSNLFEYCRRYQLFLDAHSGITIIRYEDFVARPATTMRKICKLLRLHYFPNFHEVFSAFHFSGDSGRGGDTIRVQPRRPTDQQTLSEIGTCSKYEQLCERLGYAPYF